jgi:hypothetical protein
VENAVIEVLRTAVDNIYALAWRAGLLSVDGDDPLSRMFCLLAGRKLLCP